MAWNEPGGSKDNDPWGKPSGDQGPPDLDEVIRKLQNKLGGLFGGKSGGGDGDGGGGGGPVNAGMFGVGLIAAIIVLVWLASGIYIVAPAERGVVQRFGEFQESTAPGPHWHFPFPIESVTKVDVDNIRTIEIGYRTGGRGDKSMTSIPTEALMLTRDENIVDIKFAIQYKVKDAADFLFKVKDPTGTLQAATESAVREAVGKSNMDFVLTEGRSEIAARISELTQEIVDRYETGLLVTSVNMQDAQPPEEVQSAFHDAVKAREDEQRLINEAEAYSNDVLPKARGMAARQLEEANAYKEQVIAQAEGEASRFEQILTEYAKAPNVTRERLYLETMEDVLSRTNKVVVDLESGNNLMLLPLDKLGQTAGQQSTADDLMRNLSSGVQSFSSTLDQSTNQTERDARNDSARSRERR